MPPVLTDPFIQRAAFWPHLVDDLPICDRLLYADADVLFAPRSARTSAPPRRRA